MWEFYWCVKKFLVFMFVYSNLFMFIFLLDWLKRKVNRGLKRVGIMCIKRVLEKGIFGFGNICYLVMRRNMLSLGMKNI